MFNEKAFWDCVIKSGLSLKEIAMKSGIGVDKLIKKLMKNGDFNKSEINRLCCVMAIQKPEGIFFAS